MPKRRALTPPTRRATEHCPSCGAEIAVVVVRARGPVVTMRSCNACDRRWWEADGRPADPARVLAG